MSVDLTDYVFIGVDIGGSHITAAQVMPQQCAIQTDTKVRLKVDSHANAEYILDKWAETLRKICGTYNKDAIKVGIAMPGPFNYEEGISLIKGMNKYEALYGLNIRELLSSATGLKPENILFRNDAEAFLHGEVVFGKIPGASKVIGVTLGTGLGSAKSANGITTDVFRAVNTMHDGIAEDYISTRWFQKRYEELSGRALTNVEDLLNDADESLKQRIFNEFAANLGSFLTAFAVDEQADIIIIGGNIAKSMHLFIDQLTSYLVNKNIKIKQSILWEDAALIGAACSWPQAEMLSKQIDKKMPA
jgi:glucokinase